MEEIEVKFLDIDPLSLQKKLKKIGAKKIGEYSYRRMVFDYSDLRLDKRGAWIRLRDEGDKTTLTYKQRLGIKGHGGKHNDDGMQEIEVEVSDFKKTADLLLSAGLAEKYYQENKRIRWAKGSIEFDIDFWPGLKPYLEIEAKSWKDIDKAIRLLGLNPADKKIFSTNQVYALAGIREIDYQRITFDGFVLRKQLTGKKSLGKKYYLRFAQGGRRIFDDLCAGRKKVETRAATVRYKGIKKGDSVVLWCGEDRVEKTVRKAETFYSIDALLKKYKVRDIDPTLSSAKELRQVYASFPGYTEKIRQHGLIALEFEK